MTFNSLFIQFVVTTRTETGNNWCIVWGKIVAFSRDDRHTVYVTFIHIGNRKYRDKLSGLFSMGKKQRKVWCSFGVRQSSAESRRSQPVHCEVDCSGLRGVYQASSSLLQYVKGPDPPQDRAVILLPQQTTAETITLTPSYTASSGALGLL